MRNARLLTTVLLTALAATNAFAARNPDTTPAAPAQLFALDKAAQPPASRWLVPDEAEEFAIQTNPEAVARNPRAFTVDLPGLPPLEATRRRFVVYRPDWKSWIGTLRRAGTDEPATGYIHLGYHGKQLTGFLEFEGERYRIVNLEAGHRLVRLSEELGTPSCGIDAVTEAAKSSRLGGEIVTPEEAEGTIVTKIASNRLDLLVVYPKAFFPLGPSAESRLVTFVQDSVSMANDVFVNSSVDAAYNLVGVVPITGSRPAHQRHRVGPRLAGRQSHRGREPPERLRRRHRDGLRPLQLERHDGLRDRQPAAEQQHLPDHRRHGQRRDGRPRLHRQPRRLRPWRLHARP